MKTAHVLAGGALLLAAVYYFSRQQQPGVAAGAGARPIGGGTPPPAPPAGKQLQNPAGGTGSGAGNVLDVLLRNADNILKLGQGAISVYDSIRASGDSEETEDSPPAGTGTVLLNDESAAWDPWYGGIPLAPPDPDLRGA